jgi:hypothetical protein
MDDSPNIVDETTQTALPLDRRRDGWLERRLGYLAGEQARLNTGPPLRRFWRGAVAAYRRFLFTADPAHRFTLGRRFRPLAPGWSDLSAGADREAARSAPDGPGPGRPLVAGLTDRPH